MDNREMIEIINGDGTKESVELVTYLITEDQLKEYIVYTKREIKGNNGETVIYISRLFKTDEGLKLTEISDETEWLEVQRLLKKIANA